MPDQFTLLNACNDQLPTATLVDRINFYRFVALLVPKKNGSGSKPAVYPQDRAIPERVREAAAYGYPPDQEKLERFRGGIPLLKEWNDPPEECGTVPFIKSEIPDLDEFLANPKVKIDDGADIKLTLTRENITALLKSGATFVRRPQGPPILIQAAGTAVNAELPERGETIYVPNLTSVVAGEVAAIRHGGLRLTANNLRELRNGGETWITRSDGQPPVRFAIATDAVVGRRSSAASAAKRETPDFVMASSSTAPRFWRPERSELKAVPEYEVDTFPFVLYLPYRQDWTLIGFARGDLLNSIALAPQEEASFEVFSWDRYKTSSDLTDEFAWESSLEAGITNRLTRDLVKEVTLNESWKLTNAGVQVGIPDVIDVDLSVAGDFGTALTTVNKGTINRIDEATTKAAFKSRGMRQTKITDARELGFEQRSTRKLKNPNSGRTITYDMFEVLASYEVSTYPVPEQIRLAVLVKSPVVIRFDRPGIIAHEGVLRRALLDHKLAGGFDSASWLAARDEYCAMECAPPCCPDKAKKDAEAAPPPLTSSSQPADGASAETRVLNAGDAIRDSIVAIRTATHHVASAYDAGVRGAELEAVILEYRQWLFRVFGLEKWQTSFWGICKRFENEFVNNGRTPERVEQFINEVNGAWGDAARGAITAVLFGAWTLIALAAELVFHLGLKTGWYMQYTVQGFDDAGLGERVTAARTEVETWRKAVQAQIAVGSPPHTVTSTQSTAASAAAGTPEQTPNPFPDDMAARHIVAERALKAHLVEHSDHYLEAVWRSIGPEDRARLIYSAIGNLADHVSPEILGFFGDRLALPFDAKRNESLKKAIQNAVDRISNEPKPVSEHVVLSTPGVHIQSRVGACDAMEPFIARHRELDIKEMEAKVREATARAERAEHEAARLKARLEADPKLLDDPSPALPVLNVKMVKDEEGGNPAPALPIS